MCNEISTYENGVKETRESTGFTVETCIDGRGVSEATGFTQLNGMLYDYCLFVFFILKKWLLKDVNGI